MNGSLHDFMRSYKSSPDCRAESDHEAAVAEATAAMIRTAARYGAAFDLPDANSVLVQGADF